MKKYNKQLYNSKRAWIKYQKSSKKRERFRLHKAGYQRFLLHVKRSAEKHGLTYRKPKKSLYAHPKTLAPKPGFPLNVKYLAQVPDLFSKTNYNREYSGHLFIPKCFSLIDNFRESFDFLKRLFVILQKQKLDEVILDYTNCERIDVDASICMDIILNDFVSYIMECRKIGHLEVFSKGIHPRNFERDSIKK